MTNFEISLDRLKEVEPQDNWTETGRIIKLLRQLWKSRYRKNMRCGTDNVLAQIVM